MLTLHDILNRDRTRTRNTPASRLSDEQLATLPTHEFVGKRAVEGSNTSAAACDGLQHGTGSAGSSQEEDASPRSCSICLEAYSDGEKVLTLPCLHQFHASCVVPWLKQQGKLATCPMCKTPIFA